jgi:hypothetical protein
MAFMFCQIGYSNRGRPNHSGKNNKEPSLRLLWRDNTVCKLGSHGHMCDGMSVSVALLSVLGSVFFNVSRMRYSNECDSLLFSLKFDTSVSPTHKLITQISLKYNTLAKKEAS